MEYRKIGNTDIEISAIAFGAWAIGGWMWGGNDKKDSIAAINQSLDLGITTIDTAPIYGMGTSEDIVGEALEGKRDKVKILTKYGMRWDDNKGDFAFDSQMNDGTPVKIYKYAGKESVIKECEDSLKRLKTDYIDLYQIHWNDSTTPIHETMEAVAKLKQDGKILAAGVCNYTAKWVAEADEVLEIVSNQVPYSMVLRDIEKEVVPQVLEKNKSILAYSPLQRGLLTGKITPGYKFGEGDHRAGSSYFKDENVVKVNAFLDKIKPIADDKGLTLAQLVIRWTIDQPGVTCALVGARNEKQVKENAAAAEASISEEEMNIINTELAALKLDV
ncbi:aldo/keto reductase [Chondrinema litorale]|uniref:aldo/keto reductase n=1 Tax=Chondrinema litorale TaxID=2994555 RepID=UPI0025433EA9|nr:aldo/keto reductase [Chondrinema litorale]UZR94252.1 aldo/keto reductase [Chondrinema litorale]